MPLTNIRVVTAGQEEQPALAAGRAWASLLGLGAEGPGLLLAPGAMATLAASWALALVDAGRL